MWFEIIWASQATRLSSRRSRHPNCESPFGKAGGGCPRLLDGPQRQCDAIVNVVPGHNGFYNVMGC